MKKRFFALTLALLLCLSIFSGCSDTTDGDATDGVESEPVSTAAETTPAGEDPSQEDTAEKTYAKTVVSLPITEEDVTITIAVSLNPNLVNYIDDVGETTAWREIAERTGVDLDFDTISAIAMTEQYSIMFTSGEYLDVMQGGSSHYTGGADKGVEDGVFVDLTELIEEYAPNYNYYVHRDDESLKTAKSDAGYMSSFIFFYDEEYPADFGVTLRGDWMDELGLDLPVTYDDYYDVLKAFNSEYDSSLWLMNNGSMFNNLFVGGYGVNGYMATVPFTVMPFYVVDGDVKFGYMEDGYVNYLTMISEWYSEGLITDKIIDEDDWNPTTELIANGEVGIWSGSVSNFYEFTSVVEDDAYYPLAAGDPVLNEGDEIHFTSYQGKTVSTETTFEITSSCENPEIAVQVFDYRYSDEGSFLCNYGVENEGFVYVNGEPQYTDLIINNENGLPSTWAKEIYASQTGGFVLYTKSLYYQYDDTQLAAAELWGNNKDRDYVLPDGVSLTTEENNVYNEYISDITTLCSENILSFIVGYKSMDEYQDFIDQLVDMGIEKCIGVYQDAYDRYVLR